MPHVRNIHVIRRDDAISELAKSLDELSSNELSEMYSVQVNSMDTILVLDGSATKRGKFIAATDPHHQGEPVDVVDESDPYFPTTLHVAQSVVDGLVRSMNE